MGFQPSQCAVVEDSLAGITAANSAGMVSVLYDPQCIHSSFKSEIKIKHMRELKSALT
jgi:beta-phosphoglucomutase-like phosphatase (HAD superfamily)